MRKALAAIILTVTMIGVAAVPASASSTAVDCSSDPGALQPAIDAARSGSQLALIGTCVGNFVIAKNLTLRSSPGTSAALSTLALPGATLTVTAGVVVLKNLVVTNALCWEANPYDCWSSGIRNLGTLTLQKVTVTSIADAPIWNSGTLTMLRSNVSDNGVDPDSYAIYSSGEASITESTISDNSGGGIYNTGHMTIDATTISGNVSDDEGGGIHNQSSGSLLITRSTITGNNSDNFVGGGIANRGALDVVSSTIANNIGDDDDSIHNDGTMTLTATIVWNARGIECDFDSTSPIGSGGYNVIGSVDGCQLVPRSTDLVGHATGRVDPRLGSFGPHGGPTATFPLKLVSPALNAIPVGALATDGTPLCPATGSTDQRGKPRPQGGACDIGAYETKF